MRLDAKRAPRVPLRAAPERMIATALWRRLDTLGHDAARLARVASGWRLDLAIGQAADCPVVWLDAGEAAASELAQRYERIAPRRYRYQSPSARYDAVLEVMDNGFVRRYPGLWAARAVRPRRD